MTDTSTNAVLVALRTLGEATPDQIAEAALITRRYALAILSRLPVKRELRRVPNRRRVYSRPSKLGYEPTTTVMAFYSLEAA